MTPISTSLRRLRSILGGGDVRAGLVFMNGLTEHRFTSLYLFDRETLKNLYFFDREHPEAEPMPDIPVMASYCVFVRDSRNTFATADARTDDRVGDHPKRRELLSYCGVPLRSPDGEVFGSICHFDYLPVPISDANVELMEAVAPLIWRALQRPAGRPSPAGA